MTSKKSSSASKRRSIVITLIAIAALAGFGLWTYFQPLNNGKEARYVYIDNDDTIDSVFVQIDTVAPSLPRQVFHILTALSHYDQNIHTGRYLLSPDEPALATFRRMRNAQQEPVRLTVPSVRTLGRLSHELSKRLMADSTAIHTAMRNDSLITSLGYDTATIAAMFIPNTYEIYWNISPADLLKRMQQEHERFWDKARRAKATDIGLTDTEVSTLASIIDEETANDAEKPMIAGMYLNRLKLRNEEYPEGMPLQADPTIKFAIGDFSIRRIYHAMLTVDSPYNTYINPGLPPGPIRIPSVAGIDAVLNHANHDYLYMCAKEDFSGTHNFARTYREHLQNAARYSRALNQRGIRR